MLEQVKFTLDKPAEMTTAVSQGMKYLVACEVGRVVSQSVVESAHHKHLYCIGSLKGGIEAAERHLTRLVEHSELQDILSTIPTIILLMYPDYMEEYYSATYRVFSALKNVKHLNAIQANQLISRGIN